MPTYLARLLLSSSLVAALSLVAGCSTTTGIPTNPNAFPFPSGEIFAVTPGVKLSVENGYPNPAQHRLINEQYCDLQLFTETAAAIVRRELAAKGIVIEPGADKKVVLRVVEPVMGLGFGLMRGLVSLEATFGSTTITVEGEARSGGGPSRVFDAALTRAVSALLKRADLQAYLAGH